MTSQFRRNCLAIVSAGLFLGSLCVSIAKAQEKPKSAGNFTDVSSAGNHSPYRPIALTPRAIEHYQAIWGVDSFGVRLVESGEMVRFSYRVTDGRKAVAVNEKKSTPYLVDEAANVKLVVPNMEKVGELRQSGTPETGKSYWMVFSNKGGYVKRGDRVNVEIGKFRVEGLVVE